MRRFLCQHQSSCQNFKPFLLYFNFPHCRLRFLFLIFSLRGNSSYNVTLFVCLFPSRDSKNRNYQSKKYSLYLHQKSIQNFVLMEIFQFMMLAILKKKIDRFISYSEFCTGVSYFSVLSGFSRTPGYLSM